MTYQSADRVQDEEGRQYHIGLAPGEVAPWILLVGDPSRAERVAEHFQQIELRRENREYVSVTGTYRGLPVTVMGTGIGCDNTEIAMVELLRCCRHPTILRVGSCGALDRAIDLGDSMISRGAVRLESTSLAYAESGYPALAHHEVVLALISAAESLGVSYHAGMTATAAGFYANQGRSDDIFESQVPDLVERLGKMKISNFEMESSTLFTLASLAGVRAGTVCAVFGNRVRNEFIAPEKKGPAEHNAIRVALRALEFLAQMDENRGRDGRFFCLPSRGDGGGEGL